MNLENIGISYLESYLLQGSQIERCIKSANLKVNNTELLLRTDKKDCDIEEIRKVYDGNILFHVPAINPDLGNLKLVNEFVRELKMSGINMITINASNLSLDLFEWSTLEEQKSYFLNIVTAISTLASNKIVVAIENLSKKNNDSMFGSNISQVTDIIVYSRKMLIRDFGFREEDTYKYIGLSLNIDNIKEEDSRENIENYIEIFKDSIKCIKITNVENVEKINKILNLTNKENINCMFLLCAKGDLDDIDKSYLSLINFVLKDDNITLEKPVKNINNNKINSVNNISTYIIIGIIIITFLIILMMFIVKLK